MYEVEADRQANRLYIDLSGRMDAEAIAEAAEDVGRKARRLDDGFDIINDLRGFGVPSPEDAEPIKETQGRLREFGVDRVVRITDENTSKVVVNAFERRANDVGYSGEVAKSVAEAERILDEQTVTGYGD